MSLVGLTKISLRALRTLNTAVRIRPSCVGTRLGRLQPRVCAFRLEELKRAGDPQ